MAVVVDDENNRFEYLKNFFKKIFIFYWAGES